MPKCRQCQRDLELTAFAKTSPYCCRDCLRTNVLAYQGKNLFDSNHTICPICKTHIVYLRAHYRKYHSTEKFPIITNINTFDIIKKTEDILKLQRPSDATWNWDREAFRIYFVLAGDPGRPIKIGISQNLTTRLNDFQLAMPDHLQVLLTYDANKNEEQELHIKFDKDWISGEWFRSSLEILDFIHKKLLTSKPTPIETQQRSKASRKRKQFNINPVSFEEHQHIAHTLDIHTSIEWFIKYDSGILPPNILRNPDKLPQWQGWKHFLKTSKHKYETY
jgi:hypothetical protein